MTQADGRVPVSFAAGMDGAGAGDALLIEGDAPPGAVAGGPVGRAAAHFTLPAATSHVFGCACCVPRGPAAAALSRLFLSRARGEVAWFDAVSVVACSPAGAAAVRDALASDVVTQARFRPG